MTTNEQKQTCLRCGQCCKWQYVRVPRYENSDLSPEHLEDIHTSYGLTAVEDYMNENSILQGARCVWLADNADGTTTCTAYARRSKTCRDFNAGDGCVIWMQTFGL